LEDTTATRHDSPNDRCAVLARRIITLEQLLAISQRLNSTLEMRSLLLQIVEAARELTEADGASILLVEGPHTLRFAASCGPSSPHLIGTEIPTENSLAGWVVQHRETAVVEDALSDPRLYAIQNVNISLSIVAVPLLFGERVIGVLESLTQQECRRFTSQDVETLEVLASIAAVAVENTRLFQQNDWIAEVVHEIRTPLTAILSYAELLDRQGLRPGKRHQFRQIIQQETKRVNQLIGQFLDAARLESGRATMKREPLALAEIISQAIAVIRPQAAACQMCVTSALPENIPALIGDSQRMHQVLLNLLSNAVKYSTPGTDIHVTCQVEPEQVVVAVTDSGPGIPQEYHAVLFQRFSRVPGSEKRAAGSGLGLNIARQIVEAHYGRIWVASTVGQGSTFAFSLPRPSSP